MGSQGLPQPVPYIMQTRVEGDKVTTWINGEQVDVEKRGAPEGLDRAHLLIDEHDVIFDQPSTTHRDFTPRRKDEPEVFLADSARVFIGGPDGAWIDLGRIDADHLDIMAGGPTFRTYLNMTRKPIDLTKGTDMPCDAEPIDKAYQAYQRAVQALHDLRCRASDAVAAADRRERKLAEPDQDPKVIHTGQQLTGDEKVLELRWDVATNGWEARVEGRNPKWYVQKPTDEIEGQRTFHLPDGLWAPNVGRVPWPDPPPTGPVPMLEARIRAQADTIHRYMRAADVRGDRDVEGLKIRLEGAYAELERKKERIERLDRENALLERRNADLSAGASATAVRVNDLKLKLAEIADLIAEDR